jgi:putative hydrolase of the HAD superfamily
MIQAVVFDLGGTLLDFDPDRLPWLEWERAGLEHAYAYLTAQGHPLPQNTFFAHFIDGLPERWERAAQGGDNLRLGDVMREACTACGVSPTDAEIDDAIARYIAPLDARVVIFDDTLDTLRALRTRKLKLGLVSNTMWPARYHRDELDRFGLTPYLDHTIFSAEAGVWKPQPGIYCLSLAALDVSAEEAIFVGDMPEHDIVGAQRVGMRGIYKRNRSFVPDGVCPDAVITQLAELVPFVERWSDPRRKDLA